MFQTKLNKFQSAGGLVEEQDWNQTIKSVLNFYVTWESAIRISSEMEAGSSRANSAIFFCMVNWKKNTWCPAALCSRQPVLHHHLDLPNLVKLNLDHL